MKVLLTIGATAVAVAGLAACSGDRGQLAEPSADEIVDDIIDAPTGYDVDWSAAERRSFLDGCGYGRRCQCALEYFEDEYPDPYSLPDPTSSSGRAVIADAWKVCG